MIGPISRDLCEKDEIWFSCIFQASAAHGVEQAFRPAVKLIEKSALAAEVPDPGWLEMKDAPSCMDTPPVSAPAAALPDFCQM